MIYIKFDDTIIDIIQKIEQVESWDIFLDIPVGHPLLHNYISLKILRNKVEKSRRLVIITSDRLSKKIGQTLGIEYSLVRNKDVIEDASKAQILQENFSMWEYLWYQLKHYKSEVFDIFEQNKKVADLKRKSKKLQEKVPFSLVFWLFFLSILLFVFIYYIAISKTFITIRPELSIRKEALNFTFTEEQSGSVLWESRNIQVERISKIIEIQESFSTSLRETKDEQSAFWKIRIYNITPEPLALVPNTRFMSADGVIYDIDSWIQVPAAVSDNFWQTEAWTIEVTVKARPQDIQWAISGLRWNIASGSKLILPWLSEDMQDLVYAETIEDFTWWTEEYVSRIAESDIDIAKRLLTEKLRSEVMEQLKNDIDTYNILNNTTRALLTLQNTLDYGTPQIFIIDDLKAWDSAETFELQWIIELKGFMYNEWEIIQRLRRRIDEKRLEWVEKILQVDANSLKAIELISRQNNPFRLKASFEIEIVSEHDFLHQNNTYIEALAERIRGLDVIEAERVLLNDIFISQVEIQNRPFFRKKISRLPRNIFFEIRSNE